MNAKGLYASVEAMLSLLLLVAVLLSIQETEEPSLENLYLLQKENDLLKLWVKNGIPPKEEMVADFALVFPGKSGEIRVNESIISVGNYKGNEAMASEILFIDSQLNKTRVALLVFK